MDTLGEGVHNHIPFLEGCTPMSATKDSYQLQTQRTWKAQLAITGAGGIPDPAIAGNVLRPETTLALSIRLPPTLKAPHAIQLCKDILLKDPPFGAKVTLEKALGDNGWNAPDLAPWIENLMDQDSKVYIYIYIYM